MTSKPRHDPDVPFNWKPIGFWRRNKNGNLERKKPSEVSKQEDRQVSKPARKANRQDDAPKEGR